MFIRLWSPAILMLHRRQRFRAAGVIVVRHIEKIHS